MTGPKRVLVIFDLCFPFTKGGAQRRFYEVSRVLVSRGWKVDWLTFKAWDGQRTIQHEGMSYIGLGELPHLYGEDGKRKGTEPLIFAWEIVKNLGRLRKYDVIWVGQWPLLHVIPVLASSSFLFRKRVVLDWWEVWSFKLWTRYRRTLGLVGFCVEQLTLRVFAPIHVIVTDTGVEEDRLRAITGLRAEIHRISNGVPREEIGDVGEAQSKLVDIVSLGRLKDHKRVDLLLSALILLKERYGEQPTVEIIGDGPERERLEAVVREHGLEKVVFHGFVEDMRSVYSIVKSARVCVITTQSGGGGNLTLLEAYGCGVPVVAFRIEEGIDPHLVEHGRSGLLVSPPTHEALAENLRSLLCDPEKLDAMGKRCLEKARDLSWSSIARLYAQVFESVTP